jgi:hypothetical protein
MLHAGGLGGLGDVLRLRLFLLGGEVLPEIGDAVHAMRAGERLLEAFDVVDVGLHYLCAGGCQRLGFVLARIARDRANGKAAVRIGQDRASQSAALRTCRTYYGNDLLVGHLSLPRFKSGPT